jgi:hypothetical protein
VNSLVLSTERLDLWQPAARDHAALIELLGDEEVRRHLARVEHQVL